ncbi:unnamed protein product [Chrysoparadoxa australica]
MATQRKCLVTGDNKGTGDEHVPGWSRSPSSAPDQPRGWRVGSRKSDQQPSRMDQSLFLRISEYLGDDAGDGAANTVPAQPPKEGLLQGLRGEGEESKEESGPPPLVHMIAFSKDRAFQLGEMLRSSYSCLDCAGVEFKVTVLYLCSPSEKTQQGTDFFDSYRKLQSDYPEVEFVQEEPGCFFPSLRSILQQGRQCAGAGTGASLVLWAVDDMFFFERVPLHPLASMLLKNKALSFHTKLHPGVTFSHPASATCRVPSFMRGGKSIEPVELVTSTNASPWSALLFRRSEGILDWDYPWDLTGGICTLDTVEAVLDGIEQRGMPCSNPNELELSGHTLLTDAGSPALSCTMELSPSSACMGYPALSAITVNKVQTTYNTPVYESTDCDVESLDKLLWGESPCHFSPAFYQSQWADRVHVGELVLESAAGSDCSSHSSSPSNVSVVLPVHNAGRKLSEALSSIMVQLSPASEVIVIDDGSSDGCVELCREAIEGDARVRVLRLSSNRGVAYALNYGILEARHDLIVRMDADDISLPHRLSRLVLYMDREASKQISVAGSMINLFNEEGLAQCCVRHPTEPGFMAWSLFFSCCLAHPSVIMRRSHVIAAGGYREEACPAEDYDLWLRLEERSPGCVTSLGEVLLLLRKYEGSVSSTQRQAQQKAASNAVCQALTRTLGLKITSEDVVALQSPASAATVASCRVAKDVLEKLPDYLLSRLEEAGMKNEHLEARIRGDARARLSQLAIHALKKFGSEGAAFAAQAGGPGLLNSLMRMS